MGDIHYRVVEHMGGWAYKLGDSFSETFDTKEEARIAAIRAANEMHRPGEDVEISYQDEKGHWVRELARGSDRPDADVAD